MTSWPDWLRALAWLLVALYLGIRMPMPPAPLPTSAATCNGVDDLNCADFSSDAQAQAHLLMCANEDRIDGDEDGRACEFE